MSSVVINGDTSGAITITSPAVAGTNTITLPAATGTMALNSGTLTSGRVTYATTGGLLTDSANLTFDGNSLTLGNGTYSTTYKLNGSSSGTGSGTALYFQNTGTTNFAIGNYSTIIGGAYNIDATYYLGTANNHLFYTNTTEKMRIDSSGNVGIGTTSAISGVKLNVNGGVSSNGLNVAGYGGFYNSLNHFGVDNYLGATRFYSNGSDSSTKGSYDFHISSSDGSLDTTAMRIDSSGNLLVGTTSTGIPTQGFSLAGTSLGYSVINIGHATGTPSGYGYASFGYNGTSIGTISQNGTTGVLYNLTSDYRLKNNPAALTGASDFIMALQPKTWDWYDGSGKGVGFIAHEFMEVAKYSGNGTKDAVDVEGKPVYQSIQPSSSEVMANIVALMQEQQALIESLTTRLTALEAK